MSNFGVMHLLKRFNLIMEKKSWAYISFLLSATGILTNLFFATFAFGQIKIVDANTIIFNNEKIRLFGIDTPETEQYCYVKKKLGDAEN